MGPLVGQFASHFVPIEQYQIQITGIDHAAGVEITTRTTCGFYLLPPTRNFARIFAGVLVRVSTD